jgi:hypothetical protein
MNFQTTLCPMSIYLAPYGAFSFYFLTFFNAISFSNCSTLDRNSSNWASDTPTLSEELSGGVGFKRNERSISKIPVLRAGVSTPDTFLCI